MVSVPVGCGLPTMVVSVTIPALIAGGRLGHFAATSAKAGSTSGSNPKRNTKRDCGVM